LTAVDAAIKKYPDLQMLFVILPNNKLELYSSVKKRLSVDVGVPSQCFLAKNVTSKGLMSIATKVVIQMNAKLGGEPWSIQLPLKVCSCVPMSRAILYRFLVLVPIELVMYFFRI
jgi:hypothetical protein